MTDYRLLFDITIIFAITVAVIWCIITLIALIQASKYDRKISDMEQEAFLKQYKIEKGREYYVEERKSKKKLSKKRNSKSSAK